MATMHAVSIAVNKIALCVHSESRGRILVPELLYYARKMFVIISKLIASYISSSVGICS